MCPQHKHNFNKTTETPLGDFNTYCKNLQKVRHNYCGILNEEGYRIDTGCSEWHGPNNYQKYTGHFLYNNLHSYGTYLIEKGNDFNYLEGRFYCNKLEGYGVVVYADGSYFEGLFKNHHRFGPGVKTNSDNTQDVGLWTGFFLKRLATEVHPGCIPRFGKTHQAHAKLFKFKKLVSIQGKPADPAKEILRKLGAKPEIIEKSDVLYNLAVRHPNSQFFNKKLYDDAFFPDQDCTIDVIITKNEFDDSLCSDKLTDVKSDATIAKNINLDCSCTADKRDRFTQICVQLHNIEHKLQSVEAKRTDVIKKLTHCKACYLQATQKYMHDGDNNATIPPPSTSERRSSVSSDSDKKVSKAIYTILNEPEDEVTCNMANDQISHDKVCSIESLLQTLALSASESTTPGSNQCKCEKINLESADLLVQELHILHKQCTFYRSIKDVLRNKFSKEYDRYEGLSQGDPIYVRKVSIHHLLAWNSEQLSTDMLRHIFRHRKFEEDVSFKVGWILGGNRANFKPPGVYETHCTHFLEFCYRGLDRKAFTLLRLHEINPDLCDFRGNTGIFYAVVRFHIPIITLLVKCGANVNITNDEGLTPLSLAFLIYLTLKFRVIDWEKAFLREPRLTQKDLIEAGQYTPHQSLYDLINNHSLDDNFVVQQDLKQSCSLNPILPTTVMKLSSNEDLVEIDSDSCSNYFNKPYREQECIFNVDYQTKLTEKSKKAEKLSSEDSNGRTIESIKLGKIKKTIIALCSNYADPNVGEVPMPLLCLSIFTADCDLVRILLENNAKLDTMWSDENLSSLHIVASLEPSQENVSICKTLLRYGANPNLKTGQNHWSELCQDIMGKGVTMVENEGKNALHMLCLRDVDDPFNYLGDMVKTLIENNCNVEDTYLGHTPLSLAVLNNNIKLIKDLFDTERIDPHQMLGCDMGNVLTMLILKRYAGRLSVDKSKELIDLLISLGTNPLREIGNFENVVHFMDDMKSDMDNKKVKSKKKQTKVKKVTPKKKEKNSKKASKKKPKKQTISVDQYLISVVKSVLFRHIQGQVVKYLYTFVGHQLCNDSLVQNLAKIVTPEQTLNCIRLLFQYGRLKPAVLSNAAQLLDMIRHIHDPNYKPDPITTENEIRDIQIADQSGKYLPPPEVDEDLKKYQVCFQCLRRKDLVRCPDCEMIYFCSKACNLAYSKTCKLHMCPKVIFYDEVKDKTAPSRLDDLHSLTILDRRTQQAQLQWQTMQEKLSRLRYKSKALLSEAIALEANFNRLCSSREEFAKTRRLLQYENIDNMSNEIVNIRRVLSPFATTKIHHERLKDTTDSCDIAPQQSILKFRSQLNTSATSKTINDTLISKTVTFDQRKFDAKQNEARSSKSCGAEVRKTGSIDFTTTHVNIRIPHAEDDHKSEEESRQNHVTKENVTKLLSKVFSDFNLPLIMLPYACYKDGQIYYSMSNNPFFNKMFNKLPIKDM